MVLAAGIGYAAYKNKDHIKSLIDSNRDTKLTDVKTGRRMGPKSYNKKVNDSMSRIWETDNYLTPDSLNRGEIKLDPGHTFHRLSDVSEHSFRATTYSTSNVDDFNRYVSSFRSEIGSDTFKHIQFKATKEVKVPSTKTVLDTLKSVMEESPLTPKPSSEDVMQAYNTMSGGSFESTTAKSMISKLISQGYSAIVDEMDAGVIGEAPLVVIDPSSFTSKTSSALSAMDIMKAELSIKEITNRK